MTSDAVSSLTVEIYADGADLDSIKTLSENPLIKGFTTNPTLLRKAGVTNYASFAQDLLGVVPELPISFEVIADEPDEIERQALVIAGWGDNVFVKLPVTTTDGTSLSPLARRLADQGVKLNVTALMTEAQVAEVADALAGGPDSFISVFAGRVADTGRDPIPVMERSLELMAPHDNMRLIWASPRELLNVFQADEIGCDVITVTHDVLAKLKLVGKDLDEYSLETVQMFFDDAAASGFTL
ncbi:MAG: transaldolase [Acidimicrobiales bacterium]|nr:transaldolase [Acidimicrobiales bacterium]